MLLVGYSLSCTFRFKVVLKKLLKLFIIGLAIAIGSFAIMQGGIMSNSMSFIIMVIPAAIGIALVMFSVSIGIKKWVRGLERD